jgi:hypothetical protein
MPPPSVSALLVAAAFTIFGLVVVAATFVLR